MRIAYSALFLAVLALPAESRAQNLVEPPHFLVGDLACAPRAVFARPAAGLRVIGTQDTTVKSLMGAGDTLVINAGREEGLQEGMEFFVRRLVQTFGADAPSSGNPLSVKTSAVIRIQGVGDNASTAEVIYSCDGILLDDYLDPFEAPMVARAPIDGEPQHDDYGRVLYGDEDRELSGKGDLVVINRGSDDGVRPGQRFTVYRDKHVSQGFLVEIGTLEAITVRPGSSMVQVVEATDAISRNDLVATRR